MTISIDPRPSTDAVRQVSPRRDDVNTIVLRQVIDDVLLVGL